MAEEVPGTITLEVDFSHVPVKPTGAKEIRELEVALIIASLFRPDVLKTVLDPKEFTTWVDSLAVAAGALAREKAGYPISKIAEELGRTEATIRRHLSGETKAGKIVRETYDMLVRGKLRLALPREAGAAEELQKLKSEVEGVKKELDECRRRSSELEERVKKLSEALSEARRGLEEILSKLQLA